MTEPHTIGVDSRDLRDLIDERDRLAESLAECTREAMKSADEWRVELDKARELGAEYGRRLRTIQELLGYDQPNLLSEADLAADIRALVEYKLSAPTRPEFWRPAVVIHPPAVPMVHPVPDASLGARITGPAQNVDVAAAVSQVLTDFEDGSALRAHVAQSLDGVPGWSHDQGGPPAAPRATAPVDPQPRTWAAGDPEPPCAGPCAVWGVVNALGDLYRPQPRDDQYGAFWTDNTGAEWTWTGVLVNGPVTEAFQPSPEPRADHETTPAGEALNEPVTSDDTENTDPELAW